MFPMCYMVKRLLYIHKGAMYNYWLIPFFFLFSIINLNDNVDSRSFHFSSKSKLVATQWFLYHLFYPFELQFLSLSSMYVGYIKLVALYYAHSFVLIFLFAIVITWNYELKCYVILKPMKRKSDHSSSK